MKACSGSAPVAPDKESREISFQRPCSDGSRHLPDVLVDWKSKSITQDMVLQKAMGSRGEVIRLKMIAVGFFGPSVQTLRAAIPEYEPFNGVLGSIT